MTYFNEFDAFAAQWLRNLFPQGIVDDRSIRDVRPAELSGYDRCHFFGGIGGWEYALHLAGWPADREVWTGSCPCQPFSSAGKRKGEADERHLWPEFFRLIRECRPATIFGEQVASPDGLRWLDGVFADMEGEDYSCGAADLCAASVGAPHIRQRLFWVAHAGHKLPRARHKRARRLEAAKRSESGKYVATNGMDGRMGNADSPGSQSRREPAQANGHRRSAVTDGSVGGLSDSRGNGWQQGPYVLSEGEPEPWRSGERDGPGPWSEYILAHCADGKARRIEPGIEPLAHGVSGRVGLLRGYGNAICPQVAAEFIKAYLEAA